ncbi:MAG: hypothetical protein WCF90_05355 [Methanomicrobiales archaeon]
MGGHSGLIATLMTHIKKDYRDLAAASHDITVSSILPEGMADLLRVTSLTLEAASDKIGDEV